MNIEKATKKIKNLVEKVNQTAGSNLIWFHQQDVKKINLAIYKESICPKINGSGCRKGSLRIAPKQTYYDVIPTEKTNIDIHDFIRDLCKKDGKKDSEGYLHWEVDYADFETIENIIYAYAGVKKGNMEQEFREYLENYTALVAGTVNIYATALKLGDDFQNVYSAVREAIEFNDFYEIQDISSFLEQYNQIEDIIPNQHNTNNNGNDNGNLSAALGKYKLFLQYLEVVKQMDLYDENSTNFPLHDHPHVHWYFKISNRNNEYPIKAICREIGDKLQLQMPNEFTTDEAKAKLKKIFEKNMKFYDSNIQEGENMTDEKLQETIDLLKYKKQIILQGSPGTGKTRMAKEIAQQMAPDNHKLIQFHPAYSYEDFVRGIVATTDDGAVSYEVQNKVLAEMAEKALDNSDDDFVLIIDEINRANLPAVLGELIYALEYRGEAVESMYEYDNSRKITLPKNLYIIGTMNTADRSVGHIDYAIRRRFAFVDVKTDRKIIENKHSDNLDLFDEVAKLFNDNLSEEFDKDDVMIGHSYFLNDDLEMALEYEIKPILYEYVKDGVLTCKKSDIDSIKC